MADSFDWVTERFKCSVERLFKELELGAKTDVDTIRSLERNLAQETGGSPTKNIEVASDGRRFSVTRSDRRSTALKSVEFTLESSSISVKSSYPGGPSFAATIQLNDEGRCLFVVEDLEMEPWQVRRKALQDLFFGGPHQQIVTVSVRKKS
jgi:hypothetical protein